MNIRWHKALFEQLNLGSRVGGFRMLAQSAAFYMAVYNFGLITITAWHTTLRPFMDRHLPWFGFPHFSLLVLFGCLAALYVEYRYIYPAMQTFSNRQWYVHRNPMRRDLLRIARKLDDIDRRLLKLEEDRYDRNALGQHRHPRA